MPRTIEVSAPAEKADAILERVRDLDGVVGLARQPGASIRPPGDVLTIRATNEGARAVFHVLEDLDAKEGGSILTSQPRSLISPERQDQIDRESNETVWDEMAFLLRGDTNLGANYLALMALSGATAAAGLWTDSLHIVVGAMVIAPAFEPLMRIPFGLISGTREVAVRGAMSSAAGYLAMALGGAVAVLLLRAVGSGASADLEAREWVRFWSTVKATGVVTSTFAAMAGAVVVCSLRSVLTTGVMIALALVPSMAIVGMAVASGDFPLAGRGLVRWAVDAAIMLAAGAVVFGLKQALVHRRRALS